MRRTVVLAFVLLFALPGCEGRSRPEGVVERWLLAINQGAAGRAGRYATPQTSRLILPGFSLADPGELDVVEVGEARRTECATEVPFRVVRLDGEEITGYASLADCPTAPITPIASVRLGPVPDDVFPSGGGSAFGTDRPAAWLVALLVGVGITLVGVALMELVHRTARD